MPNAECRTLNVSLHASAFGIRPSAFGIQQGLSKEPIAALE
jgi:hypothetical protein